MTAGSGARPQDPLALAQHRAQTDGMPLMAEGDWPTIPDIPQGLSRAICRRDLMLPLRVAVDGCWRIALSYPSDTASLSALWVAKVSAGPFWFRRDMAQLRHWRDRLALSVGLVTVFALGLEGVGVQAFWQAQDRATLSMAALDWSSECLKVGAELAQAALALLQRNSGSQALVLAHLAQTLPQDSYLTTLLATSEGIIPAISADPVFATVNFAGPAAHDLVSGSYSFSIHTILGALL